ncbi:hypothetical protein HPB48_008515 [Haemaphysalis longicornis]|uniref:SKP1 component POZ domain-containing protein n=1 Tax=Haemaphysalis longicornis TaxID=44386 RepID=A0A9J6H2Q1_HAELO|nr:hypothetical protein HPB48_008515 [Haemaphysalis longicornis]
MTRQIACAYQRPNYCFLNCKCQLHTSDKPNASKKEKADGQSHLAQAAIKKEEMPAEGVYIFFPANSCQFRRQSFPRRCGRGEVVADYKKHAGCCGVDGDDVVPLSNVRSEVLEKVLIWAAHHKDDGPTVKVSIHPPEFAENKEARTYDLYVAPWDRVFLVENRALLFELVGASIYLNISRLQDVACKTFAHNDQRQDTGGNPANVQY